MYDLHAGHDSTYKEADSNTWNEAEIRCKCSLFLVIDLGKCIFGYSIQISILRSGSLLPGGTIYQ